MIGGEAMPNFEKEAAAGTTAEEIRKKIEATKLISSNDLSELDNLQIALRLYFLVANGTHKSFEDFCEIGSHLGSIAANLKANEV